MRKLLLILSLLAMPWAWAQAQAIDVFDYPLNDAQNAREQIYVPAVLSGAFTQEKQVTELGVTLKSSGVFAVDHNGGILWHVLKPKENRLVIKNGVLCLQNAGSTQTFNAEENQTFKHVVGVMQSLLLQDLDDLKNYFDLYFYKKPDNSRYYIGLKTTDSVLGGVFTQMTAQGAHYIEKVVFNNSDGDITTIIFANQQETFEEFDCDAP